MKFEENFAKHKIKNLVKISWNYKNKNFAATLLLHNVASAFHPPLLSARRFFTVARQCYFEMKMNTEPYISILWSIILCLTPWFNPHIAHMFETIWNGIPYCSLFSSSFCIGNYSNCFDRFELLKFPINHLKGQLFVRNAM